MSHTARYSSLDQEGMSKLNKDEIKKNLVKYEQNWLHHIRMVKTLHTQKNFTTDPSEEETWTAFKETTRRT
jgi:hypothetical protein